MKATRVRETAKVSARALQRNANTLIDTHDPQYPFAIPVSQLLRFERHRGFEHGQSTREPSHSRCLQSLTLHEKPRTVCRPSTNCRLAAVVQNTTISLPHSRSFASQVGEGRRQPPKLPPKAPPRRALTPRPPLSTRATQEDEEYSSIPATTGDVLHQQEKIEQDQFRIALNRERALDTPWFIEAKRLNDELDASVKTIEILTNKTNEVPHDAQEAANRVYMPFEQKVLHLEQNVIKRIRSTKYLSSEMESSMAEARKEGLRNHDIWHHFEAKGINRLEQDVDTRVVQIDTERRKFADLWYNIHAIHWENQRARYQTEAAIRASQDLKADSSNQSMSRVHISKVQTPCETIANLLDELDGNLMSRHQSISQTQADHYVKMLRLGFDTDSFAHNIVPLGHNWRMQDHYNVMDSRNPGLNNHVSVATRARAVIDELRNENTAISRIFRKAVRTRRGGVTVRSSAYESMRLIFQKFNDHSVRIADQYLDLLQEGLVMLNPAMRSELGRLKYAAMRPFRLYNSAMSETQRALRDSRDDLKILWELHKHAVSRRSAAENQWSADFLSLCESAHKQSKETIRSFLSASNEASYRMFSLLSPLTRAEYLRNSLEQQDIDTEIQLKQDKMLHNLSSLIGDREHSDPSHAEYPLALLGSRMELYPQNKMYPVELVSSNHAVFKALRALLLENVVGIDILRAGHAKSPFISIASTEKVLIIDWHVWTLSSLTSRGLNQVLLTQLLEDANIVKVIHDVDSAQRYFSPKGIYPRSMVSLTALQKISGKGPVSRMVTTGFWTPPHREFQKIPLMSFITDLAFLSAYNLWTVLLDVPPKSIDSIEPNKRINMLKAREKLLRKIAATEASTAVELGPVNIDPKGAFKGLMTTLALQANRQGSNAIVKLARLAARSRLEKMSDGVAIRRKFSKKQEGDLSAYYMLTSMGQDLASTRSYLERPIPAKDILDVAEKYHLPLHADERMKLEAAEKHTHSDFKSTVARAVKPSRIQNIARKKAKGLSKASKVKPLLVPRRKSREKTAVGLGVGLSKTAVSSAQNVLLQPRKNAVRKSPKLKVRRLSSSWMGSKNVDLSKTSTAKTLVQEFAIDPRPKDSEVQQKTFKPFRQAPSLSPDAVEQSSVPRLDKGKHQVKVKPPVLPARDQEGRNTVGDRF